MIIKEMVTARIDFCLNHLHGDEPEKLKFLLEHERKNILIKTVVEELQAADLKVKLTKETINLVCASFAKLFSVNALKKKEEDNLSHTEKVRREMEAAKQKEYEAILETDNLAMVEEYAEDTK
jgi:hypothetical protein